MVLTTMNSFRAGLVTGPLDPSLLSKLRSIYVFQGKMALFEADLPDALDDFRRLTFRDTVYFANALDGQHIRHDRARELGRGAAPEYAHEEELVRYARVIQEISNDPPKGSLRAVAETLYRRIASPSKPRKKGAPGPREWFPNTSLWLDRTVEDAFGSTHASPMDLDELEEDRLTAIVEISPNTEPLLDIGATIFDFLCLRPFPTGNSRVARALMTHLLNKAGYSVAQYVSLDLNLFAAESTITDAFQSSALGWPRKHVLLPWLQGFVGLIDSATRDLDGLLTARRELSQGARVRDVVLQLPEPFTVQDVEQRARGVSRTTINRALREMRVTKLITPVHTGRYAKWQRVRAEA